MNNNDGYANNNNNNNHLSDVKCMRDAKYGDKLSAWISDTKTRQKVILFMCRIPLIFRDTRFPTIETKIDSETIHWDKS